MAQTVESKVRSLSLPPRVAILLALVTFAVAAYGPALGTPFLGDDYVFLDEVMHATFLSLWSPEHTAFGWYRPFSRELHFWALWHTVGASPMAFRLVSLLLWVVAMDSYRSIATRIAGVRIAGIATLGAAAASLWGAPLLWISGTQDLWMLVFVLIAVRFRLSQRGLLANIMLFLALLSKETAAVTPFLFVALDITLKKSKLPRALLDSWPSFALVLGWFILHPTLIDRLMHPAPLVAGIAPRPALGVVAIRALLAGVNAERAINVDPVAFGAVGVVISAAALLAGLGVILRAEPAHTAAIKDKRSLVLLGLVWGVVGWAPVFMPSVGWQAYYGCLGILGLWLSLGTWLSMHARVATVLLGVLAILRGACAATPSKEWGSEWYQRRAGNMLSLIHSQLMESLPQPSPHSRIFFGSIPNNIGLIAGQSPAVRVWYQDTTLTAGFYSYYVPRAPGRTSGEDYFFHFDTTAGLSRVHLGPESIHDAMAADPNWEINHESLAVLLLGKGDPTRAAVEFEKISMLVRRPDAAMFAAAAWDVAGEVSRRDSLLAAAAVRTGGTTTEIQTWFQRLRASAPQAPQ